MKSDENVRSEERERERQRGRVVIEDMRGKDGAQER